MPRLQVLVSGAGIAGCTLAYWLTRHGHSVTVVERSRALRATGSPVDVRGAAVDVAKRMSIYPQLQEARISLEGMTLLGSEGEMVSRVEIGRLRSLIAPNDIEIARGDLSTILYAASADRTEYIFGDYIESMTQDEAGVDVVFAHASARRFDLVAGADGLHSNVRRLAFGPEAEFVRHAGLYAATVPLAEDGVSEREMFLLNTPGRLVAYHPCRGAPIAYFVFWREEILGFDHSNLQLHKKVLDKTFHDIGWKVPQFLDAMRAATDIYFDSVAELDVSEWSRGRIVLLGDASSCVSLFGDGSTLAIVGAERLATELEASSADPPSAFRRYQSAHHKLVASKRKNVIRTASRIVPRTQMGIWLSSRVFWRAMQAIGVAVELAQTFRQRSTR